MSLWSFLREEGGKIDDEKCLLTCLRTEELKTGESLLSCLNRVEWYWFSNGFVFKIVLLKGKNLGNMLEKCATDEPGLLISSFIFPWEAWHKVKKNMIGIK